MEHDRDQVGPGKPGVPIWDGRTNSGPSTFAGTAVFTIASDPKQVPNLFTLLKDLHPSPSPPSIAILIICESKGPFSLLPCRSGVNSLAVQRTRLFCSNSKYHKWFKHITQSSLDRKTSHFSDISCLTEQVASLCCNQQPHNSMYRTHCHIALIVS